MLYPATNKFILFGHARSGTTTLADVINSQNIKIILEPFNKGLHPEYALETNLSDFKLKQNIKDIYSEYDGIKHLFGHLSIKINSNLIKQYPIIFLRRKNLLQASLSLSVLRKTKLWAKRNGNIDLFKSYKIDLFKLYENIGEIDIGEVKKFIKSFRDEGNYYELILKKYYKIYYEDLYLGEYRSVIKGMFNFINRKIIDWEEIKRLMDKSNKLNSLEAYNCIKNIKEIKRLQSKENGYL